MVKMDMQFYAELGKILKSARENRKMSLDQLSESINGLKKKSTLKRYEDGESRIDMDVLSSLCDVLNLDMSEAVRVASARADFSEYIYENINPSSVSLERGLPSGYITDPEPELIVINRAMKNMSKEKKDRMMKLLKLSFEEEFDKNDD